MSLDNKSSNPSSPTPAVGVCGGATVELPLSARSKRTIGERILSAGFALLAAHALLKIVGILIKNIIPNYYGAEISDVYVFVSSTVLGTAFAFGEQCLSPALLPVFTRVKEKDGEARAWRYLSLLFNLQLVVVLALTFALAFFATPLISLLTQWDAPNITLTTVAGKVHGELLAVDDHEITLRVDGQDRVIPLNDARHPILSSSDIKKFRQELAQKLPRRELGGQMLPWVAWALIGMSLASLTYGILIGYKRFFWAAFGDAALRICVALGALFGVWIGNGDWRFIATGAVVGGTGKLLVHLIALGSARLRQYRFTFNLRDPYLGAFMLLVLPLLAGIIVSSIRGLIINKALTTQALLPTYFQQGQGAVDTLAFLIPFALSVALLPYFCDLAARDDNKQLGQILTHTIRKLLWFFLPVTIILVVAALPICFVLYSGKLMTLQHIQYPALVMRLFALQLPFAALEMMVMQAFFSNRRMLAPTLTGIVFSIISASLAYWLVIVRDMNDIFAILLTVALCVTLAKILKACILVGLLKTTVPVLPLGATAGFLGQLVVVGSGAALTAWGATQFYHGPLAPLAKMLKNERLIHLTEVVIVAAASVIAYLALSWLLKMDEPRQFWQWTKEKLKRRGSSSSAISSGGDAD
ncbi:MAG: lipid II flippase MurJ [Planctomycetota bacterium]